MLPCSFGRGAWVLPTFREILLQTETALLKADVFFGHGYESAHDEAVALVLAAARLSPFNTGTEVLERAFPDDASATLGVLLKQRCGDRLPLAYVTGEAYLGPLCFKADSRALVPRSPIAEIILNGFAPWFQDEQPAVIVDVCCGGGSLGMLAKLVFPNATVVLSDLDDAALALTQENSQRHPVDGIVKGDLLAWCADDSVDIVIANPPYVDAHDMADLPPEYRHEPGLALVGGDDGLDLVRVLLHDAARLLRSTGLLLLEVGNSQDALDELDPCLHPTWVDLEQGGHGVAAFMAQDLAQWAGKSSFNGGESK